MRSAIARGGPVARHAADAVAYAEAQGAAPGTEWRTFAQDVVAPPARRRGRPSGPALLALACLGIALWHGGQAAWLHAKAALGQVLLEKAWHEVQASGQPAKPWPWADTHPVARLRAPAQAIDLLVLEGANGRTLAWGPGHVAGTPAPGAHGTAVVTGHRDTHFAFLRDLRPGDPLVVEAVDGSTRRYRVERTFVADRNALRLPHGQRGALLALVTCYPFDAVDPGTPLRYAVIARATQASDPDRTSSWAAAPPSRD